MGLDVRICVELLDSPARLRPLYAEDWQNCMYDGREEDDGWGAPGVTVGEHEGVPVMVFDATERFYGPGYERGCWPKIFGILCMLQQIYPGATVWYGSDADDVLTECTAEWVDSMWRHYTGPDGNRYWERD